MEGGLLCWTPAMSTSSPPLRNGVSGQEGNGGGLPSAWVPPPTGSSLLLVTTLSHLVAAGSVRELPPLSPRRFAGDSLSLLHFSPHVSAYGCTPTHPSKPSSFVPSRMTIPPEGDYTVTSLAPTTPCMAHATLVTVWGLVTFQDAHLCRQTGKSCKAGTFAALCPSGALKALAYTRGSPSGTSEGLSWKRVPWGPWERTRNFWFVGSDVAVVSVAVTIPPAVVLPLDLGPPFN